MKKYYCFLTIMALVLTATTARAAIYMVGNNPFGDWNPGRGVEMTDKGNGTYTLNATINGTVWFVFADGQDSNWNTFNANYRYGPTGGSQEVTVGNTYTTQKSNNNHSYKFVGSGESYTFTFNLRNLTFSINEYQEPPAPDPFSLQVGDVNGDGEINIADVNGLIDILLGRFANYDTRHRADPNYDGEINIADVNAIIHYILGGDLPEPVKEGYDYVWDDDVIPEIHIDVSRVQWNRLLTLYDINAFTTQYVAATLSFVKDGETTVIDSVGLRLKGNTSRRRPEGWNGQMHERDNTDWHHVHFGINLQKFVADDDHSIQDVRKLHLKWFKDDPAYVREMYCYELFRRAGVWTAVRNHYCRLWLHVEGDSQEAYYGVYEMMEPIDKRYLKDRKDLFGSNKGYLWKCRNGAAGLNNPNGDIWYDDDSDDRHAYTLKTQTEEFENARAQLVDFMDKVCNLSDNEFFTWIQQATDVDLLLKTYAVNVAVGMWDDYWNNANNYYIYFNAKGFNDYQFFFIPYDYDNTLGTSLRCGVQSDAGRQDPLHWGNDNNRLIARILKFNDFKAKYVAYLKELIDSKNALMDRASSQARIRSWQQRIEPYVDNDTGEDTVIEDKPASWGNHGEYNLLKNNSDNFFTVKASSINALN
ncbi:MAG: CotH kinase family protein [Muribaculaceae bacterium]|nr:CotH kinase family protein [Muribaculaceae bacterium]